MPYIKLDKKIKGCDIVRVVEFAFNDLKSLRDCDPLCHVVLHLGRHGKALVTSVNGSYIPGPQAVGNDNKPISRLRIGLKVIKDFDASDISWYRKGIKSSLKQNISSPSEGIQQIYYNRLQEGDNEKIKSGEYNVVPKVPIVRRNKIFFEMYKIYGEFDLSAAQTGLVLLASKGTAYESIIITLLEYGMAALKIEGRLVQ